MSFAQVEPSSAIHICRPTWVFSLWLGAGVIGEKGGAIGEDGGDCEGSESLTSLE